ncbi:pyrimidine reductase family protein [Mycobacterium sp.]|uniref:pyrimidine reductase family protein n=1 Tax=Mycobacterium sp. TaxID=1785 RepID=UPI00126A97E0|nr:pyrimidine reductase family protein [Mycobacterium sp.]KAA8958227.1 MAG: pyrimidine reductase family protein [Mycobacterium sp.]
MPGPQSQPAAPPLTLLGSARRVDDDELAKLYAYPDERVWVRANFIASLDGAAALDGTTSQLGGPVDRALFNLLRALADVILVGAGTVRTENYAGARPTVTQRQHRAAREQSEVPPLAIVTKSGHLDRDMPVFTNTEVAPLVLTCTIAAEVTRRRLAGIADVIDCSAADPGRVDEGVVLNRLTERGLRRILTEGGPTLLGSFLERGMLDELCLTVAPCLVGGRAQRIAAGPGQLRTPMRCVHILTDDDGYLYTRYVKTD